MTQALFHAARPVTLVGGGPVDPRQLEAALRLAPEALAADGGGNLALPGGRRFRAVIGDMDSLRDPAALARAGVALYPIAEQDSTDLEKCLYSVEAPLFLGLGFLGGRLDHQLAAMSALAKHPEQRVMLLGGEDICFLCPPAFELDLAVGTRVSLFPMGPVGGLRSEGLRWSVAGLDFAPGGRIGTSNEALGGPMRIAFDAPRMLVVLPGDLLAPVVAQLRGAGALSRQAPASR
ncbi:MAG TPA: thiamine diphosphokinase [Amaricoccus sp.]|uniref:thiamine diphosphokinase n=1 Tax=Amaricoccus sp. TaxID=1872485 RepID=UPI002BDFAB23|nr:thiamine diphosphokinase [Amaricoccus sp.]HMQ94858.1 thiamine diphosphokinase [Amaricoccus sp.]HMR52160.1 thiamine diphosphokinase [Amaricoccus sp.]HMR59803.1 thiamine diphosphokinase [Amaricoccus sp.]HMT99012.1 thiamine diphosphokinase [Amaricoccus sp.]